MAEADRVRLHITPFNKDLLDRYVPPSLKAVVSNISFHTVETFPERGFGYVELPAMEAQKLKSKLNGSTLKGSKVKIEVARPEKKRKSMEPIEDEDEKVRKKAKKEKKKKKREDGVLPGHELPEGRHVKRGWVDDANKKSKKTKNTLEGKKMRFKTEVPANKVTVDEKERKEIKEKSKEKETEKAKRIGKKATVVKEFSKAAKPNTTAALRGNQASSYEDGKGWVDAEGNVIEAEPETRRRTRSTRATQSVAPPAAVLEAAISNKDEASLESEEEEDDEQDDLSSISVSESEVTTESEPLPSENEETLDRQLSQAKSNTATNAAAEIPEQESTLVGDAIEFSQTEQPKEVHPLEALFKRPVPAPASPKALRPTPIDTSFSFFAATDADGEDATTTMTELQMPQTPHTKQDLEWRSIRSAAPTPDTAAIGKKFNFTFETEEPESDDADEVDEDVAMADIHGAAGEGAHAEDKKDESEFRKWFYDNRGELNRGWKKRRREERKVVRQRENRRVSRRIA